MDITPEQLRFLREQRRMTREELAKELNCSAGAIVQWEGAKRSIPSWVADKMFAKMPVEFTIQELAEMYDLCREEAYSMSELIQEGVRALIKQRREGKTSGVTKNPQLKGNIIDLPQNKVAEEPPKDDKNGTDD